MARVNLDGKVWKDPRIKRLARSSGRSIQHTVGTLAAVWDVAYDLKSPHMSMRDIDTAADFDGFAQLMIGEDLAEQLAENMVRIRGVTERIAYLLVQAERGRKGGLAKAKRSDPSAGQAGARNSLGIGQAGAEQDAGLPPDPSPSPSPSPLPDRDRDQREVPTVDRRGSLIDPQFKPSSSDENTRTANELSRRGMAPALVLRKFHQRAAANSWTALDWDERWRRFAGSEEPSAETRVQAPASRRPRASDAAAVPAVDVPPPEERSRLLREATTGTELQLAVRGAS